MDLQIISNENYFKDTTLSEDYFDKEFFAKCLNINCHSLVVKRILKFQSIHLSKNDI